MSSLKTRTPPVTYGSSDRRGEAPPQGGRVAGRGACPQTRSSGAGALGLPYCVGHRRRVPGRRRRSLPARAGGRPACGAARRGAPFPSLPAGPGAAEPTCAPRGSAQRRRARSPRGRKQRLSLARPAGGEHHPLHRGRGRSRRPGAPARCSPKRDGGHRLLPRQARRAGRLDPSVDDTVGISCFSTHRVFT